MIEAVPQRLVAVAAGLVGAAAILAATPYAQAPPFPSAEAAAWIGAPASWASLRGHVVLLDVWTFG